MLPQSIINKILAKYGKDEVYSSDCASLAGSIGIGETTVKRMLGLVGENSPEKRRTPHVSTMDVLSKWLGYDCYKSLLKEIGEEDSSSEFTSLECIHVADLDEGTQIKIKYQPARVIVMTYLGGGEFIINDSKNSKLMKGDRIQLTHLVLGHELLIREIIRNDHNIGGYRGAKDGGLISLEIIV